MIRKLAVLIFSAVIVMNITASETSFVKGTESINSNFNFCTTCYASVKNNHIDVKKDAKKITKVGELEDTFLKAVMKKNLKKVKSTYKKLKKLNKYAVEPSVYNMSVARRSAFKKIIKNISSKYFFGYYLADIDGDDNAELITLTGSDAFSDKSYTFYSYDENNGKIKKYTTLDDGYEVNGRCADLVAYPNHAGVIIQQSDPSGIMSYFVIKINDGKLVKSSYTNIEYDPDKSYFYLPGYLDDHIGNKGKIDYSAFNN